MIYPPNFPPDYGNQAEKKVYEALAGLPGEECDVFFHKTFSGTENMDDVHNEKSFLRSFPARFYQMGKGILFLKITFTKDLKNHKS